MSTTLRQMLTTDRYVIGYNVAETDYLAPYGSAAPEDSDAGQARGGDRTSYGWNGLAQIVRHDTAKRTWDAIMGEATHVQIGVTGYGDYAGGAVERSNNRSLLRDFPDVFVEVTSDYGYSVLAMALDQDWEDDDRAAYVADIVRVLADEYPLYDEDDHGNLMLDMAYEDWQSWARDDAQRTYRDALVGRGVDEDTADAMADHADLTAWVDQWQHNGDVDYEAESAVSGTFYRLDEMLQARAAADAVKILA